MGTIDDAVLLLLRLSVVALLYLFLIILVLTMRKDLSVGTMTERAGGSAERLIVLDPGSARVQPGEAIRLRPVTLLGRGSDSSVVLEDDYVSTRHAAVFLRDGRWWLRDEGSTNGTLLNGQPVPAEALLQSGDEIQIGQVRLEVAL